MDPHVTGPRRRLRSSHPSSTTSTTPSLPMLNPTASSKRAATTSPRWRRMIRFPGHIMLLIGSLFILYLVGWIWTFVVAPSFQWKRLSMLSDSTTAFGEIDGWSLGKSCQRQRHVIAYWKYSWVCRDCGNSRGANQWEDCPILKPRGKCPSFAPFEWDAAPKPRASSYYDFTSSISLPTFVYTTYGVGKALNVEYIQPGCTAQLSLPCFDLERCKSRDEFRIFAYGRVASHDVKGALLQIRSLSGKANITLASQPEDACMLVVHESEVHVAQMQPASWRNGANHFVYSRTGETNVTGDQAFPLNHHLGLASFGTSVATTAHYRYGYDVALPLVAQWSRTPKTEAKQTNKKYLLSFRGSIQDTLQPYYQHRWLAAEYWSADESDIVVDVQCKHKTWSGDRLLIRPFDNPDSQAYDESLLESIFVFCPGGSGVGSYRFMEALQAGAIPVVLPELVLPWAPEVDWSSCVVTVSQSRIIDLPRRLRQMSNVDIEQRQDSCRRLYRSTLEDPVSGESKIMATTLQIWDTRIQNAIRMHDDIQQRIFYEKYR